MIISLKLYVSIFPGSIIHQAPARPILLLTALLVSAYYQLFPAFHLLNTNSLKIKQVPQIQRRKYSITVFWCAQDPTQMCKSEVMHIEGLHLAPWVLALSSPLHALPTVLSTRFTSLSHSHFFPSTAVNITPMAYPFQIAQLVVSFTSTLLNRHLEWSVCC